MNLYLASTHLVLVSSASFANTSALRSQICYVTLMGDKSLFALYLEQMPTCVVLCDGGGSPRVGPHPRYGDWLLGNKKSNIAERQLQTVVCYLKESYEKGELRRTGWIPGKENAADVLTKELLSHGSVMWKLIKTNKLRLDPVSCASR